MSGTSEHADIEAYRKNASSPYVLVFGRTARRGFVEEMFTNTTTVPVIDFGAQCVCCDGAADTTKALRGDGYGDYYGGDIFRAPVCRSCKGHAIASAFASRVAATAGGIGGLLILIGCFVSLSSVVVGLSLTGLAVVVFGSRSLGVRRQLKRGHHAGLDFHVNDGCVTVFTHNPRLVRHLLDCYGAMVAPLWKNR